MQLSCSSFDHFERGEVESEAPETSSKTFNKTTIETSTETSTNPLTSAGLTMNDTSSETQNGGAGNDDYCCRECNLYFPTEFSYRIHLRTTDIHRNKDKSNGTDSKNMEDSHCGMKEGYCYCYKCDLQFFSDAELDVHYKLSTNHFFCKDCLFEVDYISKKLLMNHIKRVHPSLYCDLCNKNFDNIQDKQRHNRNLHFHYKFCPYSSCSALRFKSHDELMHHCRTQHGENFCFDCNTDCRTDKALRDHRRYKHPYSEDSGVKKYHCYDCDRIFWTKRTYQLHRDDQHCEFEECKVHPKTSDWRSGRPNSGSTSARNASQSQSGSKRGFQQESEKPSDPKPKKSQSGPKPDQPEPRSKPERESQQESGKSSSSRFEYSEPDPKETRRQDKERDKQEDKERRRRQEKVREKRQEKEKLRQEKEREKRQRRDDYQTRVSATWLLYKLLGVNASSSHDEIERAAKKKRIETHPDKLKKPGMTKAELNRIDETAKEVGGAAEILLNPAKRSQYNAEMEAKPAEVYAKRR